MESVFIRESAFTAILPYFFHFPPFLPIPLDLLPVALFFYHPPLILHSVYFNLIPLHYHDARFQHTHSASVSVHATAFN